MRAWLGKPGRDCQLPVLPAAVFRFTDYDGSKCIFLGLPTGVINDLAEEGAVAPLIRFIFFNQHKEVLHCMVFCCVLASANLRRYSAESCIRSVLDFFLPAVDRTGGHSKCAYDVERESKCTKDDDDDGGVAIAFLLLLSIDLVLSSVVVASSSEHCCQSVRRPVCRFFFCGRGKLGRFLNELVGLGKIGGRRHWLCSPTRTGFGREPDEAAAQNRSREREPVKSSIDPVHRSLFLFDLGWPSPALWSVQMLLGVDSCYHFPKCARR